MIRKWLSQVRRLNIFLALDSRRIRVPLYLKGENLLLFEYWYANTIISAEKEGVQFIFKTKRENYYVYAGFLDSKSLAIAEALTLPAQSFLTYSLA